MDIYIGTVELEDFSVVDAKYYERNNTYGFLVFSNSKNFKKNTFFKILKGVQLQGIYIKGKATIEIYYTIETQKAMYVVNGNITNSNW